MIPCLSPICVLFFYGYLFSLKKLLIPYTVASSLGFLRLSVRSSELFHSTLATEGSFCIVCVYCPTGTFLSTCFFLKTKCHQLLIQITFNCGLALELELLCHFMPVCVPGWVGETLRNSFYYIKGHEGIFHTMCTKILSLNASDAP